MLGRALRADGRTECIVYTWDYHTSASIWSGLRVLPILSDEVQTYKALITVHKVLQEGHPKVRWWTVLKKMTGDGQAHRR